MCKLLLKSKHTPRPPGGALLKINGILSSSTSIPFTCWHGAHIRIGEYRNESETNQRFFVIETYVTDLGKQTKPKEKNRERQKAMRLNLLLSTLLHTLTMATQKSRARNRWEDSDYHRRKYRSLGTRDHTLRNTRLYCTCYRLIPSQLDKSPFLIVF